MQYINSQKNLKTYLPQEVSIFLLQIYNHLFIILEHCKRFIKDLTHIFMLPQASLELYLPDIVLNFRNFQTNIKRDKHTKSASRLKHTFFRLKLLENLSCLIIVLYGFFIVYLPVVEDDTTRK